MKRRDFLRCTASALLASQARAAAGQGIESGDAVPQNVAIEKSFRAAGRYADPFNDVEFSVRITFPDGREQDYPGYWAGGDAFKFRFSAPVTGEFRYVTHSSHPQDRGLHGQKGTFRVVPYEGDNALLKHGPIRLSENRRYFVHQDGTPFLWLGDTWWCGLVRRLSWPEGFQLMTRDRREKGFNAIQFTVGLAPSGTYFDRKNENEKGLPWDEALNRINPAYFDAADLRVFHLVDSGLVPVVVPCWGFYILRMGVGSTRKFWHYIMARWGALPAVWCLAGELSMPYYTSPTPEQDGPRQIAAWSEVLAWLRAHNPWGHLISAHPKYAESARNEVLDPSLLDFDMLQTGHLHLQALPKTLSLLKQSRAKEPVMPVLVDEVAYEGIAETNWEDVQRQLFWASVLSGSPGFTYGAHGITQFNSDAFPSNIQPHGLSWGEDTWQNAYQYRGSKQVGIGRKILVNYDWPEMAPHPEWVPPARNPTWRDFTAYAAGIPGRLRIIYYAVMSPMDVSVLGLEPGLVYDAHFVVPSSGKILPLGRIQGDATGTWTMRKTRRHDLVLIMQRAST